MTVTVNRKTYEKKVPDEQLLVHFLREDLALTGTHIGCDTSQCGACVVLCDGVAVKSCTLLAVQANGASLTTIEGLSRGDEALHPMQQAFREAHGLQCGYCTAGMILSAIDYVKSGAPLDEASIRAGLEGNICRCTGYHNIVRAVQKGAAVMTAQKPRGRDELGGRDALGGRDE